MPLSQNLAQMIVRKLAVNCLVSAIYFKGLLDENSTDLFGTLSLSSINVPFSSMLALGHVMGTMGEKLI